MYRYTDGYNLSFSEKWKRCEFYPLYWFSRVYYFTMMVLLKILIVVAIYWELFSIIRWWWSRVIRFVRISIFSLRLPFSLSSFLVNKIDSVISTCFQFQYILRNTRRGIHKHCIGMDKFRSLDEIYEYL